MFETRILTNSVASTCARHEIPIVAYSPLGRGILTGGVLHPDDIPANSPLKRLDKYHGDSLEQNLKLTHALQKFSQEYIPHTMAQLALSWIRHLSSKKGLPVIVPISGSSREENVRANSIDVDLMDADMEKIDRMLREAQTVGDRGYEGQKKYLDG